MHFIKLVHLAEYVFHQGHTGKRRAFQSRNLVMWKQGPGVSVDFPYYTYSEVADVAMKIHALPDIFYQN